MHLPLPAAAAAVPSPTLPRMHETCQTAASDGLQAAAGGSLNADRRTPVLLLRGKRPQHALLNMMLRDAVAAAALTRPPRMQPNTASHAACCLALAPCDMQRAGHAHRHRRMIASKDMPVKNRRRLPI